MHGCNGVHRTYAETAADNVAPATNSQIVLYLKHTTSRNIHKRNITDDSLSFKTTCDKSAVSREQLYI